MIAVTILREEISSLDRAMDALDDARPLLRVVGREGVNRLKKQFRQNNRTPNKLGGKRENFWEKVAQTVQQPVPTGDMVEISITHPAYAQKLFGGVIRAKRVKNLAIPQTPEAKGRYPATFEQETGLTLFVVNTKTGIGLAVAAEGMKVKLHYVLTPSVDQEPDANAFPDRTEFTQGLGDRATTWLERRIGGGTDSTNL